MEQAYISNTTKFIYAVQSAVFPGLIKIGRTQNVKERLSQLNTACAPSPFVIVAVSPSLDCIRDEKRAHEFFSDHRKEGEFFAITESQVIELFKTFREIYDSESKQMALQGPELRRDSAREGQVESFLKMMLAGMVKAGNDAQAQAFDLDQNHYTSKKRKLEREYALFEMDMAEKKQRLLQDMADLSREQLKQYEALCPGKVLDDRARLLFKDNLLNLACSLADPVSALDEPITVRSFALEEGKHYNENDLQRIEEIMSNLYEKKYGRKAPVITSSSQMGL
jgi:hypothetical protein